MTSREQTGFATRTWAGDREGESPAVTGEPALVRVHSPSVPVGEATPFGLVDKVTVAGRRLLGEGILLSGDERASRVHAGFERASGGVVLKNESKNGTWVDGARVDDSLLLRDGAVVRMGDTLFVFRQRFEVEEHEAGESVPGLVGRSPEARRLRAEVRGLASTDARVVLLGETGTGKEVVARALHAASKRAGAFVAVNCGAVHETLAESTFFGHKKGAFTGATESRDGAFQAAHKGTLFLDELGELPLSLQPTLLRTLDDGRVQRVGEIEATSTDVRVVSATNRDLESDVESGGFRSDLFARLSDVTLRLPPLRERREDVLLVLAHALGEPRALTPDLAEALLLHRWPFNVREVYKVAKELSIRGRDVEVLSLPLVKERLTTVAEAQEGASEEAEPDRANAVPDRDELLELLQRHDGVLANIARATGRSRRQVYRWLEKHGIDPDRFRDP